MNSSRPLSDSLLPPKRPAPDFHRCAACGGYHGSVGFELQCLERALLAARAALRAAESSRAAK